MIELEQRELSLDIQIEYKRILLRTLNAFIVLCKQHDIHYCAAYGTVLGAVRHKGLIPWDDDIDVAMDRDNYNRFLALKNDKSLDCQYEILDSSQEGYFFPYAKFCDATTTIQERKDYKLVIGVFIDVFPMDVVLDTDYSRMLLERNQKWNGKYILSYRSIHIQDIKTPVFLLKIIILKLIRNYIKKKVAINDWGNKYSNDVKIINYASNLSYERALFPIKWVQDTIEVPFEDMSINIPKDYDAYLNNLYGNYMKYPPMEEQKSQHNHFFVDLKKRLSISEIKHICKY